jgi:hypothetical protein
MKKILLVVFCGVLAAVCGCQTRITATKNPETAVPIYATAKDGVPYIRGYQVLSGGWEATARSPLWADEAIKGLSIGVATNGTVTLSIDDYSRDLSTNAVTMAHNLVSDFATLAEKAAAAYATAGASVAAAGVKRAIAAYILKGGSAANAKVTCENGACTFSDGLVTETCPNCFE